MTPTEGTPANRARTPPDLGALSADLSTARLAVGARDNLVGTLAERALGIGLFLALPFLLSPNELGTYYEVVALVTILVIVGVMGIDVAIVRFTALAAERRALGEARAYLAAGIRLTTAVSTALAAGLWLAAPWLGQHLGGTGFVRPARLGAVAIPFLVSTFVLVAPARGVKLMWPTVLATQVCQPAISLLATFALVFAGFGLAGAVSGLTVAGVGSFVLAVALLRRLRIPGPSLGPPPSTNARLVRFALPVAGMTLTGTALLWVDTLLLGAFRPPPVVATYGIMVRLLMIGSAVLLTVIQIFGPFVTQLIARGDTGGLQDALRTATRWVVLVAAPPLMLLVVAGDSALSVFRQPLSAGRVGLIVLGSAFLIDAFTGPVGHVLTMSGRSWLNLANNGVALACNIGLNLILIPPFGLVGAAVSWAVVIVGLNVARILQVRSIFGVTPFSRSLARPALALGAAAGASIGIGHALPGLGAGRPLLTLAVMGLAFASVYAGALVAMEPEPDDRLFWNVLVGRRPRAPAPWSTPSRLRTAPR